MHYLVGDLQGCCDAFDRLLAQIGFSPSRDTLTVLGDLVNRGPQSLAVLRRPARAAGEVQAMLRGPDLGAFLPRMYGNEPARWSDALEGADRWRHVINVLTRIRFVDPRDGTLDFKVKEGADAAPPGLVPWFDVPGRASAGQAVAFGHWSTLGLINRPQLLSLDTGCVWGGSLTAVRVDGGRRDVLQVRCDAARAPGG
jgi:bis(5'-nucleosyl)-tetraphosphatase (symmetrical)